MRKKILSILLAAAMTAPSAAQGVVTEGPRFGGYTIGQYKYSGQDDAESNTFNVRVAYLFVDGKLLTDFYYKVQVKANGSVSTLAESAKLVDMFIEWRKHEAMYVKVGQYKLPFTFENPLHVVDQGFMDYGQAVVKLAGMIDRNGQHMSNGRDIGVQLQGDVVKNSAGRSLLHYQVGVFNGQGINTKDGDNQKDIVGGLWVMPVEGMRLGAFGWTGSYSRTGADGLVKLPKRRYAISGEYVRDGWTVRSEYIHSTGYSFKTVHNEKADLSSTEIDYASGDKADGFYLLGIAPIISDKLYAKARYDMYRPQAEWGTSKTQYEAGVNYFFGKGVQLNLEYALVNDRSLGKHYYNVFDAQLSFRF